MKYNILLNISIFAGWITLAIVFNRWWIALFFIFTTFNYETHPLQNRK